MVRGSTLTVGGIPPGASLVLDTVAFAYFFERHHVHYPAARVLFERLDRDEITASASTLVFAELLVLYFRGEDAARVSILAMKLRERTGIQFVAVSAVIAERAARLRAKYNLPTPDAVHIATALESKAEWFLTNDRRLRRVEKEGIRVWLFNEHVDAPQTSSL